MEFAQKLFENKLIDDERLPIFELRIPNSESRVQFFAPNYLAFVQLKCLLVFQMLIGCLLGVIMYYGIIRQKSSFSSIQKYLIGYGIAMPIIYSLPSCVIEFLDVRNVSFRLSLVSFPMTVALSCLEAMHGVPSTSASSAGGAASAGQRHEVGLYEYVASVGLIVRPKFDERTHGLVRATRQSFFQNLGKHLFYYGLFAVAFHATRQSGFFPFPTSDKANEVLLSFEPGHLYNTFFQAAMMNVTLGLGLTGVSALATVLTGLRFDSDGDVTDNPMFGSASPSDFWGRRWNKLIHHGLKQGVYKPVRWSTDSPTAGAVAAFCASGILHEHVWSVIFMKTSAQRSEEESSLLLDDGAGAACCSSCYCDAWFGKQLLFFCWNGVLISMEYLLGDRVSKWMAPVPPMIRSHLVVLLSLPVGHLFTADVTMAGYFNHMQQLIPSMRIVTPKR